MATSGKQLSSLPSASSIAGNNEFLTWVGNDTAQKVSRDDFIKSLPTYRQPNTAYAVGNIAYHSALPTGWYLECTTAGTSGSGDLTISSPSIGGTVTDGTVVWTVMKNLSAEGGTLYGELIRRNRSDSVLTLAGSNDAGAKVELFGADSEYDGRFVLTAYKTGAQYSPFVGNCDGTLTWAGNDLAGSAIVAKSLGTNGYIKYVSGLIVQWGYIQGGTIQGKTIYEHSFPIEFPNNNYAGCLSILLGGNTQYIQKVAVFQGKDKTSFYSYRQEPNLGYHWLAVGY